MPIHESAYEIMHRDDDRPNDKTLLELEAESVAYVVDRHFGLEDLASPNYVAHQEATAELILPHLERIRKTEMQIINAIEMKDDTPSVYLRWFVLVLIKNVLSIYLQLLWSVIRLINLIK